MSQSLRKLGVFVLVKKDVNKNPYTVNLIKLQPCAKVLGMFVEFRFHFPEPKEYASSYRRKRLGGGHIVGLISLPGCVCVAADVTME
jgi:hypothetical protein